MRVLWEPRVSRIEQIRELIDEHAQAYYATASTWWTIRSADVEENMVSRGGRPEDLPCDPRGSVLMQGPASEFLDGAERDPDHFGALGLVAFCAAFHGNLVTPDRRPWSLESWDLVTAVIQQSVWQARLVAASSRYGELEMITQAPGDAVGVLKAGGAW